MSELKMMWSRRKRMLTAIFPLLMLLIAFAAYVHAEKAIDRANEKRQLSLQLAIHLRQTSDELTRMVRSYVVTGNPSFKRYYQDILDIRNGVKPMPDGYMNIYWDLVLAHVLPPPGKNSQGVPLLEMMRRAGIAEEDFALLAEAKSYSDKLTAQEFEAMKLAESRGQNAAADHALALSMLNNDSYHQAKAGIMQPINAFLQRVDWQSLEAVHHAEQMALLFRWLFLMVSAYALWLLWRTYQTLRATLGGSAEEVHQHLFHIGRGELYAPIIVPPGDEDSVMAHLAQMQSRLQTIDRERQQMVDKIRQMAFYDPLTHLPNRRLLNDRLVQALSLSKRTRRYGALMMLDLDNFKPLNDQYGHAAGDQLLLDVAGRLTACVREIDTVARLGGDEFVVLLSELEENPDRAQREAEQVGGKILSAIALPYVMSLSPVDGAMTLTHHCTASIGVTLFCKDEVNEIELLKRADVAMYRAKTAGRNTLRFN